MTKIFITGITGYVGGDAFYAIQKAHPEYHWTALVRTKQKADLVSKEYPNVRIVLGDLDDYDIIKTEASKADIVLHTADASDHVGAAKAITEGLLEGHSEDNPGFWLHTSGTGILTWEDSKHDRLGEWSDKQYDDGNGVEELVNLPDEAFHRDVDKIVLEAGTKHRDVIKTAILCPPTIYGKGRGPSLIRSRQAYALAKIILEAQYTPIVGPGKARWNNVHVYDLSTAFLLLTEAAVSKRPEGLWGHLAYYLVENGEHVWGDLSRTIAAKAVELGYISKSEEKTLSKDEALKHGGFESLSWGLNSRGNAIKLRQSLSWKPSHPSIEVEIENILKDEKERINNVGHETK